MRGLRAGLCATYDIVILESPQAIPVTGFVLNDRTALYSDTYGYYGKGCYGRRYCGSAYYGVDDQKEKHKKEVMVDKAAETAGRGEKLGIPSRHPFEACAASSA